MNVLPPSASDASPHRSPQVRLGLRSWFWLIVMALAAVASTPSEEAVGPMPAYIGPGAGIALLGSFLAVFFATLSAFAVMLTLPLRRVWQAIRGRRAMRDAKMRRVVVLGLDGLEPTLVESFMAEGLLPNLARLREKGSYRRLGTTWPPLSPVAWSSFSTGSNPGKHNIFDFIARHPRTYRPMISSVRLGAARRSLRLGPYLVPLSRPTVTGLRKSKPFWAVLGEAGIFSAVLRVPITFPPDRFRGVQLSAMCVPDLLGTQGTFFLFCDEGEDAATQDGDIGGRRVLVQRRADVVEALLPGPANTMRHDQRDLSLPFKVTRDRGGRVTLAIGGRKLRLNPQRFTPWVRVSFHAAPLVRVHGICRFFLRRFDERFELYCTPVQIDPDRPVMPVAHPTVYATYLARQQGSFATLGLAEDTWSLSEGVMAEQDFLKQAYDIHEERREMFFDALRRVRRGMVTCVFDGPDRIQHMFWRFTEQDHPAMRGRENTHQNAIRQMYVRMDELVGQTMAKLDEETALMVISDHGFKSFRRCVDLNAWLLERGLLVLKEGSRSSEQVYLAEVDFTKTRAYAIGLAGLFVNQRGREAEGIVEPGTDRDDLVRELAAALTGLRDPQEGVVAVHEALPREAAYHGPYREAAPDIIVGYSTGYRVSWDTAVGKTAARVFSDNTKAWSGDHCMHPELVPGVLVTNLKLPDAAPDTEEAAARVAAGPRIIDIGPTVLDLLGVPVPAYMDGKSLL